MAKATLGAFLVILLSFQVTLSSTCISYEEINTTEYDMEYAPITSEGKRPLGFMKGVVPYNDPDNPDGLCVTLTGVTGRQVEVAFETVPNAKLCLYDQDGKGGCREKGVDCYRVNAVNDKFTYTFTCQTQRGCSESDVTFWYRFRTSVAPEQDTEDEWCAKQNDIEYPESLLKPPPGVIPGEKNTLPPVASSRGMHSSVMVVVAAMVLATIMRF